MTLFALWGVVNCICSVLLGSFVLYKRTSKPVNRLWFLTCVAIGVWSLGVGMASVASDEARSLAWTHFEYWGCISIPALFLHFVCRVLGQFPKKILVAAYSITAVLLILNVFGLIVTVHPFPPFRFFATPLRPLPLFTIYTIEFYASVIYAHYLLWREMRNARGLLREQIKYIFLGTSIGFIGGGTTFPMVYGVQVPLFGVYLVPVYIFTISYAIFKHQLMDIRVVLRKTVIYSLVSAALASIYVVLVTLSVHLLQSTGRVSSVPSILIAALVGAFIHPISSAVQNQIDRRFYRQQHERESRVLAFSSDMVREESIERTTLSLARVVNETLHPSTLAVYLLDRTGSGYIQTSPDAHVGLPKTLPRINPWSTYFLGGATAITLNPVRSVSNPLVDTEHAREAVIALEQSKLSAAFALKHGDNLLGFILLGHKRSEQAYVQEDLVLMQIILNQAALALERPRLANDIAGAFVHEVKTPLANISLPAELSYMDLNDAEAGKRDLRELLPKLKQRMKYIIEQALLAGGRVEAVREMSSYQDARFVTISLNQIIQDSIQALHPVIDRARVQVAVHLPEASVHVHANEEQVRIVLLNLLKNALEAVSSAAYPNVIPMIHVRLSSTPENAVFEVEDSGPGISPEQQPHIFAAGYTTKRGHGSGMGLHICRQIIRAHGGQIEARPGKSIGTVFSVSLPLANAAQQPEQKAEGA